MINMHSKYNHDKGFHGIHTNVIKNKCQSVHEQMIGTFYCH